MSADFWVAVVTSAAVGSIVSALFGIANSILTRKHERERWDRDDARWSAEPFRERRFQALAELHEAYTEAAEGISDRRRPKTVPEIYNHLNILTGRLLRASFRAGLYLPTQLKYANTEVIAAWDASARKIIERTEQGQKVERTDYEPFSKTYGVLDALLWELLAPLALEPPPRKNTDKKRTAGHPTRDAKNDARS